MSAYNFKDLTGMKFGRLTVIERAGSDKWGQACWRCKCECGAEVIVKGNCLRRANTQSCGCLANQVLIKRNTTHGMAHTKIYATWNMMIQRCNNPNNHKYPSYGGRGIKVCERWLDFQNFYDDVSKLEHFGEDGYTLDRINNDGNYELNNVRWADRKTQARNTRYNIFVEYDDVEMTFADVAEKIGINYETLKSRYVRGDRGDKLFRPVKK